MKVLLKTIFILLAVSLSLHAIEENKIKEVMKNQIDSILVIMQNKELDKKTTASKVFNLLDSIFDYKTMSKISLGKNWKKLSSQQKEAFAKSFEKKLKFSYMDKLDLYTDEKVLIKELFKKKKNRIQLYTDLLGKDASFEIIYKFHKNKNNDWLIYDVKIIGVSIIQTYRKQFSAYLKDNTLEALINSL